jgi:predicted transcriptional regulator
MTTDPPVKLQRPTDFLILEYLQKNGRNVASNISIEIDKSRSHVNVRLPMLEDYGLVDKIGPAERSGLYEITPLGEAAIKLQDRYDDEDVDFEDLIEDEVASQQSCDDNERTASA